MQRKSVEGSEYPTDWPKIAKAIKEAAGWKCVRCGHSHDPKAGYTLTVHHLDMSPSNTAWWNCPALCQRCHLHIQSKVVMERPWMLDHSDWFKSYAAGYYAHQFGRDESCEYVAAHLNELLALGRGEGQHEVELKPE